MHRVIDLGSSKPKLDVFTKTLPLKAQEATWLVKYSKTWRWWITLKKKIFSKHNRTYAHINSIDCNNMCNACTGSNHTESQSEKMKYAQIPPLIKKLLVINNCLRRKFVFYFLINLLSLGISTIL